MKKSKIYPYGSIFFVPCKSRPIKIAFVDESICKIAAFLIAKTVSPGLLVCSVCAFHPYLFPVLNFELALIQQKNKKGMKNPNEGLARIAECRNLHPKFGFQLPCALPGAYGLESERRNSFQCRVARRTRCPACGTSHTPEPPTAFGTGKLMQAGWSRLRRSTTPSPPHCWSAIGCIGTTCRPRAQSSIQTAG